MLVQNNFINNSVTIDLILTIYLLFIITFIMLQEISFTKSLSNWKTFTGLNSAQ